MISSFALLITQTAAVVILQTVATPSFYRPRVAMKAPNQKRNFTLGRDAVHHRSFAPDRKLDPSRPQRGLNHAVDLVASRHLPTLKVFVCWTLELTPRSSTFKQRSGFSANTVRPYIYLLKRD